MATATLTSQLTNVVLDPGSPTGLGTGNAQASETVIQLEGANAAAIGHSGSVGPTAPTAISGFRGMYATVTSFTRTDTHLHIWVRDLYPVRNKNLGGVSVYAFGTSEAIYYVTGLDENYVGGWFHAILNLDPTTRPAASLGTAPSANITRVGYCGNISASKGEAFLQNCYFDAVRSGTAGQGVTFYGGTSGDRLNFAACVLADTSRYGLLRDVAGSLFVDGPLTFGTAAQTTYFQDSLKTLTFSNFTVRNGTSGGTIVPAVAPTYYVIKLADGTTGLTNIDMTDITWKGASRSTPFKFDANPLATGDAYTSLRSTYVFGATITLNTLCSSTNDRFVECVSVVPSGITLTSPSFSNCDKVVLNVSGDAIAGGITSLHNTTAGVPFVTTNDLAKISSHAFNNTGGAGHAILITTSGTYAFSGNTFTGYGADASTSAAIYNNSGGLVTINITNGGGTPTYRNGTSASTVVNNAVSLNLTTVDSVNAVISGVRVRIESLNGLETYLNTVTDVNGQASTTFNYVTQSGVAIRARKSSVGFGTRYYPLSQTGTITTAGMNVLVSMIEDTIVT